MNIPNSALWTTLARLRVPEKLVGLR